MEREKVLKTILGCIILLIIILFIPESVLPEYNIIGYISILGLLILLGSLNISSNIKEDQTTNIIKIIKELAIYSTLILPLAILIYTNIRYKEKIQNKSQYVSNYQTLKLFTTILLGVQSYQLYKYLFSNGNVSINMILSIILMALLNSSLSILLWSRVAFFITDGFRSN
jgi:hypothetical protein